MKVPELEEQQGRNIYLSRSERIYLAPCWSERRPLLLKKKLLSLYGPMTSLKFQFGPMNQNSGVVRETA